MRDKPPICDFCSQPNIRWTYPADDFYVEIIQWGSEGDWAACDICAALIDSGDWEGLADRSLRLMPAAPDLPEFAQRIVRNELLKMHQGFREHRTTEEPIPFG